MEGRWADPRVGITHAAAFPKFGPDLDSMAVAEENELVIWDTTTWRPRVAVAGGSEAHMLTQVTGDGGQLEVTKAKTSAEKPLNFRVTDVVKGSEVGRYDWPIPGPAASVTIAPDGSEMAIASRPGLVEFFDVKTRFLKASREVPGREAPALAYHPRSPLLAVGDSLGRLALWPTDGRSPDVILTESGPGVVALRFSPDGTSLAVSTAEATVQVWDVSARRPVHTLAPGHAPATSLAFASDGGLLATSTGEPGVGAVLWDVRSGQIRSTLGTGGAGVRALSFSIDGKQLAAGRDDAAVTVWDVRSGSELAQGLSGESWRRG